MKHWQKGAKEIGAILLKDIINVLVFAGYHRRLFDEEFLRKFRDGLGALIQSALVIKEAIHMKTTLATVQFMVVRPGEKFDSRTMKDTFSRGGGIKETDGDEHGIVAGTTAMGVQCVRVDVDGSTVDILHKPTVVLLSTLMEVQAN